MPWIASGRSARRPQDRLHSPTQARTVDRGITKEQRLDLVEQRQREVRDHEPVGDHRGDVGEVVLETTLDLREGLRVEVEVAHRDAAFPQDEWAAVAPAGQLRWRR